MNLRDIATNSINWSISTLRSDAALTKEVQQRLTTWGYKPGPIDGIWGNGTQTAYAAFATAFKFSSKEISPPAAQQLLKAPPASSPAPTPAPTPAPKPQTPPTSLGALAQGTTSWPISSLAGSSSFAKEVQQRLTTWGYNPGSIDGIWGNGTQAAYAAFAKDFKFPTDSMAPSAAQQLLKSPTPPTSLSALSQSTATWPISSLTSSSSFAKEVQQRLTTWGYNPGPIDGVWGNGTQAAYAAFASDFKFPADSMAPSAAQQLLKSPPPTPPTSLNALAQGTTSWPISSLAGNTSFAKEVQQRLTTWGYNPGSIDGVWGNGTQAAYAAFATDFKFPTDSISPQAAQQLLKSPAPAPTPAPKPPTGNTAPAPAPTPTPVPRPQSLPGSLRELSQGAYAWPIADITNDSVLTKQVQEALDAMGHAPGPIDGLWGDRTQTGYEALSRNYSLDATTLSPRTAKLLLEPEVPNIPSLPKPPSLTLDDYRAVANSIGCETAAVRAVVSVEAAGSGFQADGRPKILFEAHWFSYFTDDRYDDSNPNISSPVWNRSLYIGGAGEWDRLYQAICLNRTAALQSASWGLGQIMGFNYKAAGYSEVESFVRDMHQSEGKQLMAMFNFIKNNGLATFLIRKDWAGFALRYNGEGYKDNNYDGKLADAYSYWVNNT